MKKYLYFQTFFPVQMSKQPCFCLPFVCSYLSLFFCRFFFLCPSAFPYLIFSFTLPSHYLSFFPHTLTSVLPSFCCSLCPSFIPSPLICVTLCHLTLFLPPFLSFLCISLVSVHPFFIIFFVSFLPYYESIYFFSQWVKYSESFIKV